MSEHSKTPWKTEEKYAHIYGAGFRVASANSGEITRDKANASHIVKCVNSHERLVEALTLLLEEVVESGNYNADDFGWPTAVSKSNAILAELDANP